MENRKFTVSGSVLNDNLYHEVDTEITKPSQYNASLTTPCYPVKLQLINATGQDAEVNILSNIEEYAKYLDTPDNYKGFTVKSGVTMNLSSSNILPFAYKLLVAVPSGVCTGNFNIDCIQYVARN